MIWESEALPVAAALLEVFLALVVPLGAMELLAAGVGAGAGVVLAAGVLAGAEEVSAIDVDFLVFLVVEVEAVDAEVEAMPPELPAPAGCAVVSLADVLVFFDFLPEVAPVSEDAVVEVADVSVESAAPFLLFLDFFVEVVLVLVELALEDASGVAA